MEHKKDGFYIKKLTLDGDNVEISFIEFEKGLNIIYGGSDVGKTFIYQCLDYMLGAEVRPKEIKESKGYTRYELEIESYHGKLYTIFRDIEESYFVLKPNKKLYPNNNDNKDTISDFLLSLTNMKNKKIQIDKYGDIQNLYFQNLKTYFLLDEDNIIAKKSHITGYNFKEKSAFRFMVTEKDDSKIKKINSNYDIKASEVAISLINENLEKIDIELTELRGDALFDKEKIYNQLVIDIKNKKNKLDEVNRKIITAEIQIERFENKVFCPKCAKELICTCGEKPKNQDIDFIQNKKDIEYKKELQKELDDLESEYQDLRDEQIKIRFLEEDIKQYTKELEKLNKIIKNEKKEISNIRYEYIPVLTMKPITDKMLSILKKIQFDNISNVEFSQTDFDFLINGEKRGIFGQGYRAIIYATFLIAILEYLKDKSYQVGFTIIDSPFNPYKVKENETKNLAHNFYSYLGESKSINELQVIIFENTKPPKIFYDKKMVRTFEEGTGFLRGELNLFNS